MAETKPNYFEPNDFDFNVEDLCLGVKLEVAVPGRMISSGKGKDVNASWMTIIDDTNLFSGENGYLSTSYSDISSLDAHNGGNKDSLGIEYININYNSWNFPEVDVKFVDIRGNAIMNPMESRRNNRDKSGSFLNALFTFPYPMFKLTVKGYYGRPVTYKLTVRDVRTNFNASNGNFEVTVKFIGYMFGYLNDIPMQYLLIAPDVVYGERNLGNFKSEPNIKIPSFRDFLRQVNNAFEALSENKKIGEIKHDIDKHNKAIKVINNLLVPINRLGLNLKEKKYSKIFDINYDKTIKYYDLITPSSGDTFSDGNIITANDIGRAFEDVKTNLVNIKNGYKEYFDKYNDRISILENFIKANEFNFLKNEIEYGEIWDIFFPYEEIRDAVKGKYDEYESYVKNQEERLNNELSGIYGSTLGWKPTIGNIFDMVLSHFNVFYNHMYTCVKLIELQSNNRNLSDLPVGSDCRYNGSKNMTVPPFPLLTNSDDKYLWIGDVNEAKNYQEAQLVEEIVKGAIETSGELAKSAIEYDSLRKYSDFPPTGIPTLLSDIYNGDYTNPYVGKVYTQTGDGKLPADFPTILKTFCKRLWLRGIYNQGESTGMDLKTFAELEALNCFISHNDLNFIDQMQSYANFWGEADFTEKIRNYFEEFSKDYQNYAKLHSLCYADYETCDVANSKTTSEFIPKNFENMVFDGDDNEVVRYENDMIGVYKYLNSWGGNNVSTFSKVFPQTIPLKYDYYNINYDEIEKLTYSSSDINRAISEGDNIENKKYSSDVFLQYKIDGDKENLFSNFIDSLGIIKTNFYETHFSKGVGGGFLGLPDKKIENNGIFKISKNFLCALHFLYYDKSHNKCTFKGPDLNVGTEVVSEIIRLSSLVGISVEKYFKDEFGKWKEEIVDKLILISERGEKNGDKYENGKFVDGYLKFNDECRRILKEICDETVTICNLHGQYTDIKNKEVADLGDIIGDAPRQFIIKLNSLYAEMNSVKHRIEQDREEYATSDKKIAIYMTLKELYDRWKFGTWRPEGEEVSKQDVMVGLKNFVFLDSHYADVKYTHQINFDKFGELVRNIVDSAQEMSVYSFLYEICKSANMTLHALPINVYDYLGDDKNKIKEMFTAYPYMACEDNAMQTTYVAMYAHKPSEHLNIVDSYNSYEDDGIDFSSDATVIKSEKPLPVFGVTYGLQNQRFFKNISVGSDNPKVTAHSLMSELLISKQATSGSKNLGFEAHDIFDVYATKSYTCKVEMMGNAMIMPMMYFQLNNIPMFKGGYFIISAEHNISRNGMTTTFTGVRVNKNRFDLLPNTVVDETLNTYENIQSPINNREKVVDDISNVSTVDGVAIEHSMGFLGYDYKITKIILDAGHDMTTPGKESPTFSIHRMNNKMEGYEIEYDENGNSRSVMKFTEISNPEPDDGVDPSYGVLLPLDKEGEEVYEPNVGYNGRGRTRYREYWGNRKIVNEIKKQLINRGVPEENIIIVSSTGRRAEEIVTGYSSKVNKIYDDCGGNCIMVSIHSNADKDRVELPADSTGANYWQIYCQNNKEFLRARGYRDKFNDGGLPHTEESWYLAKCILDEMNKIVEDGEFGRNFPNVKYSIKNKINVFKQTEEGIRPLTFCKPPTILSENFFHTSIEGIRVLGTKKGIELIAKVHVNGIMQFLQRGSKNENEQYVLLEDGTKILKTTYNNIQDGTYQIWGGTQFPLKGRGVLSK